MKVRIRFYKNFCKLSTFKKLKKKTNNNNYCTFVRSEASSATGSKSSLSTSTRDEAGPSTTWKHRRRASTFNEAHLERVEPTSPKAPRKRSFSFNEQLSAQGSPSSSAQSERSAKANNNNAMTPPPPPCTCPYFGESSKKQPPQQQPGSDTLRPTTARNIEASGVAVGRPRLERGGDATAASSSIVTWRGGRRGSSLGKSHFCQ